MPTSRCRGQYVAACRKQRLPVIIATLTGSDTGRVGWNALTPLDADAKQGLREHLAPIVARSRGHKPYAYVGAASGLVQCINAEDLEPLAAWLAACLPR